MKQPRIWQGLELPRGVFERKPGSNLLWIRYGVGKGEMKLEVAGKYTPGVRSAKLVLRDAIALLERRRTETRQGKHFPEKKAKERLRFSELAEIALAHSRRFKPRSFENDEQRMKLLKKMFGEQFVDEITAADIKHKLEKEEADRGWSPATFNNYRLLLSMAFRVAMEADKVAANPALGVKLRRLNNTRQRWLSDAEEKRLREVLEREYPEHVCEFNLLYYSGLRLSDVYGRHGKYYQSEGLHWSNVNLDLHIATIPLDKNGKVKHVPLSSEAETALRVLGERSGHQGRVMVDANGQPIRTMGKWFWRALRLAGINNFRRHDLRHNLGSLLVQNDVPILKVKEVLGHASLKSTLRYAHLSKEDGIEAANVLARVRPSKPQIDPETGTKTATASAVGIHIIENKEVA